VATSENEFRTIFLSLLPSRRRFEKNTQKRGYGQNLPQRARGKLRSEKLAQLGFSVVA